MKKNDKIKLNPKKSNNYEVFNENIKFSKKYF